MKLISKKETIEEKREEEEEGGEAEGEEDNGDEGICSMHTFNDTFLPMTSVCLPKNQPNNSL